MPIESIVADVNIDGASVWPFEALFVRGAEHSTLGQAVDKAAALAGVKVVPDPFPERMMILGSDQYSFIQRGIPALIAGTTRTGEARRIALEWLNTRYHAPGDDMAQTLDFEAAAQFTRHVFLIGYNIAQDDERPRWNPGNFYGERFGSK